MFHLVYVPHPSRTPVNRLDAEIFLVFQPPHQRTLSAGPTQRHFKNFLSFLQTAIIIFHALPSKPNKSETNTRRVSGLEESGSSSLPAHRGRRLGAIQLAKVIVHLDHHYHHLVSHHHHHHQSYVGGEDDGECKRNSEPQLLLHIHPA